MGSSATHHWSPTRSSATLCTRHLDGDSSWVLELSGEADLATLGLLRQELAHLAARQRADVVVDVSALAFCDVASAELILALRRTTRVTVTGASGTVKRVFDLVETLLGQRLPRHHTDSRTTGHPVMQTSVAV